MASAQHRGCVGHGTWTHGRHVGSAHATRHLQVMGHDGRDMYRRNRCSHTALQVGAASCSLCCAQWCPIVPSESIVTATAWSMSK